MKKLIALVIAAIIVAAAAFYFSSMSSAELIWGISNGGKLLLPLIVIAALVDSVNPCAISVLLLTIAFLFSLGRLRTGVLKAGLAYIFGLFLAYLLIGLGILQALHLFGVPNFMAKFAAVLLIVLGAMNIINEYFPRFPVKLRIPHSAHHKMAEIMERGSIVAAFILGGFVGLCEFPCTGGPYLLVLGLLHDSQTYLSGLSYLVLYNLIFIFPLVLILLIASNKDLLSKLQEWKKRETSRMRLWGGIAMIILGLFIFAL